MKIKKIIKRVCIISVCTFLAIISAVWGADKAIKLGSQPYIYSDADSISSPEVVLVLGASKYVRGGRLNDYFVKRIEAAAELYKHGKVRAFVLSGDNSRKDYNEPEDMQEMLMELGVPDSIIHLDFAGFRTLDSVVRLNKVFGQNKFIIISQPFHTERAIYIARNQGLEAYGYNAKDVNQVYSKRTERRERFARVKVFVDIVLNKKPKFLGDPIDIDE